MKKEQKIETTALIDISVLDDEFFISVLNDILEFKKQKKI